MEEQQQKKFEVPEGKKLEGFNVFCEKHGDITNASRFMSHIRYEKNEEGNTVAKQVPNIICLACLSDFISEMYETGKFGKVSLAPILKTDFSKISLEYKGAIENIDFVNKDELKVGDYFIYTGTDNAFKPGDKVVYVGDGIFEPFEEPKQGE